MSRELALDFRQEFGRDAVIDMYCYRRYGHNEGDEPSFTQPDLYAKIQKRPSVAQLYKKELIDAGTLSDDEAASLEAEFEMRLELVLQEVKSIEEEDGGRTGALQGIDRDFSAAIHAMKASRLRSAPRCCARSSMA